MEHLTNSQIESINVFLENMSAMPRDSYIHFVTIKWGLEKYDITETNISDFIKLLKDNNLSHILATNEKPEFKLTAFSIFILEQYGSFSNYIISIKNKSEYEKDIFNFTKYGLLVGIVSAILAIIAICVSLKDCSVNNVNNIDGAQESRQASPTTN